MENILIACPITSLIKLRYQIVLRQEKGEIKLNSVNILIDHKIYKKIRKADTSKRFTVKNAENIAIDFITKNISEDVKKPNKKKRKTKPTKATKMKAASDLMNEFNL